MSAMEKMLMQTLQKSLPQEVAKYLTPEGMAELGKHVGGMVEFVAVSLNDIRQKQVAILKNQAEIMEVLNINDRYSDGRNDGGNAAGTDNRNAA